MSAKSVAQLAHRSVVLTPFIYPPLRSKVAACIVISREMSSTIPPPGQWSAPPGAPADPKDASQVRGHVAWIKGVAEVRVALRCSLFWHHI